MSSYFFNTKKNKNVKHNNNKTRKTNSKNNDNKTNKEIGLLGVGKHGRAYNLGYKNKINQFQLLDNEEIVKIELYGLNGNLKISKPEDIENFKDFLRNMKNKFVKIIATDKSFGKEKQIKKDFIEEVELNRKVLKIYGNKSEKFLTVQPIGTFKNNKVMACIATNKSNLEYHLIFGTKCDNNFILNSNNLKRFIIEILESIVILQEKGFQHDDVKLDNTVSCQERYKLIDWGKLRSINRVTVRTVFGLNHSPIFLYIYKTHGKLSNWIQGLPALDAFNLEKYLIEHFDKNLLWMRDLLTFPLFEEVNNRVKVELMEIISTNPNRKKLMEKYKYTSDIYMLGIVIIYCIYKFKINPYKFKSVIDKFTSLKDPVKNAKDALEFVKKNTIEKIL